MTGDIDTDYCSRLPGQHTGRLSLDLQDREAAEWRRRIYELECRLALAEAEILRLKIPDKPRMRRVVLREYLCGGSYWTTVPFISFNLQFTGRTAEVEVPQ